MHNLKKFKSFPSVIFAKYTVSSSASKSFLQRNLRSAGTSQDFSRCFKVFEVVCEGIALTGFQKKAEKSFSKTLGGSRGRGDAPA